MNIRLVRETCYTDKDWFAVYVDDRYITGSYDEEKANGFYERVKENPHYKTKEILKSEEIDVSLKEKKDGE
jgi:hypothetical protein